MRSARALFTIAALTLIADQITKAVAVAALEPGRSVPALDGIVHWTLQRNPGAAFGVFQRFPVVFTVLAFLITGWIVWYAPRVQDRLQAVSLGLVLGGAVGNLVDRLGRAPGPFRGRVIDFIDLRVWPVFNIADAAVVVGAVLLVVVSYRTERRTRDATE